MHQKTAVFWNMILFCRLRGLPFFFVPEAFPLNDSQQQNKKGLSVLICIIHRTSTNLHRPTLKDS
jgi:hypothetical protein